MAKEWAEGFYKSKPWRQCRAGYIAERKRIDGGVCECCHNALGYIVHHKILLTPENIVAPDIALNWKHLSFECKDCHDQHEGHGVSMRCDPVVAFDEDGDVVGILPQHQTDRL